MIVNLIWHGGGYFDPKVSLLGVVTLWGDCKFIPADWGSVIVDLCYVALSGRLFTIRMIKSVKVFAFSFLFEN